MKRTYSKEFKSKVCELVEKDSIAVSVVAEKFGINHVMLHRWVSEYREFGEEAFVGKGHQRPTAEQNKGARIAARKPQTQKGLQKAPGCAILIKKCQARHVACQMYG